MAFHGKATFFWNDFAMTAATHRKAELSAAQAAEKSKDTSSTSTQPAAQTLLSGESEQIGTTNFEEDTPFGDREAWV